jgi:preprotein translocase subunit YajC
MELTSAKADIRVGDEVFDDSGVNGWGTVTAIAENKIEAEWHPRAISDVSEKRWVSRHDVRRIFRSQSAR